MSNDSKQSVRRNGKIFIFCIDAAGWPPGHVISFALAADGVGLTNHLSTNKIYARSDMGLMGTQHYRRKTYAAHYPDGYELVDLLDATDEELENNAEFQAALAINYDNQNESEEAEESADGRGASGSVLGEVDTVPNQLSEQARTDNGEVSVSREN